VDRQPQGEQHRASFTTTWVSYMSNMMCIPQARWRVSEWCVMEQ
jgi:hypothetical protein